MIATYKDYLPQIKSIDFETCLKVHDMMVEEIGNDEDAMELYNEIVEKSIEYTSIRAYWTIKDREWKIETSKNLHAGNFSENIHESGCFFLPRKPGERRLLKPIEKYGYQIGDVYATIKKGS